MAGRALDRSTGRCLFVDGPAGAGKTALVGALVEHLASERPDLRVARGRCLQSFGGAEPYLPFVEALTDISNEDSSDGVQREAISRLLTEIAPYWLSVVPLVGNVLSAGFATAARLRGQTGPAIAPSREALFLQYLQMVKGLARDGPLLLFLDDLHWADQSSVALLAHLSRGIAALPVVVIGTLRGADAELEKQAIGELIRDLEREDLATRIPLEELPYASLAELLAGVLGGPASEPLVRWMYQTAGGNPLFVGELATLLKETGAASETGGEWFLTEAARDFVVPRTAEAVIESRVQRLDLEEIRILQYASVEGSEFNSSVLSRLLEADELSVLDVLERLERQHGLIHSTGEIELPDGDLASSFRFRHALVHTVIYRGVVGKRRVLLHRRAAETLEAIYAEARGEVAGRLARHFHQGRQKESAHRYAREAAERSRRLHAHWEAEECYRLALENSPSPEDRADLEERLGEVYDVVGYYATAVECFRSALSGRSGDLSHSLRLRRKIVVAERKAGLIPAPQLLSEVRELLAQAVGDPEERFYLLLETSMLPNAVGVVDAVEEALALAEVQASPHLIMDALERLAFVLIFFGGKVEEAFPHLKRAQEIAAATGDPLRSERSYEIQGVAHAKVGRYEDALVEFQQALSMAEQLGEPRRIGVVCNNLGTLLLRLGRFEDAEHVLQRAREIHQRRDRATLVHSVLNLAERARRSGEPALAMQRFGELISYAREFEYWTSEAVAHAGAGLALLELGRIQESRQQSWKAISVIADRDEWFEDRELVEILLARLEVIEGSLDAAVSRLGRAADVLHSLDVYAWASVGVERIRILKDADPETARAILEEVVTTTAGVQSGLDRDIQELATLLRDPVAHLSPGGGGG
jgi:tetratricopeptide (TPR) repeat protein